MTLLVLAWLACVKKPPPPPDPTTLVAPIEKVRSPPAGKVMDGQFIDATYPLAVRVPDDWVVTIGEGQGETRVRLLNPATKVELIFYAWTGDPTPRPHADCSWSFTDVGHYRVVRVPEAILTATCTPDDPDHARILAYFLAKDGVAFSAEEVLPPGTLTTGRDAADSVLAGWRFRN